MTVRMFGGVRAPVIMAVAMLIAATPLHGGTERIEALVVRTLTTDDGRLGGCMVRLDKRLNEAGLDCPGSWVTLSCSGVHTTATEAVRMFASAQLAFSQQLTAMFEVTDEKKHSGHCYATRVDVLRD